MLKLTKSARSTQTGERAVIGREHASRVYDPAPPASCFGGRPLSHTKALLHCCVFYLSKLRVLLTHNFRSLCRVADEVSGGMEIEGRWL